MTGSTKHRQLGTSPGNTAPKPSPKSCPSRRSKTCPENCTCEWRGCFPPPLWRHLPCVMPSSRWRAFVIAAVALLFWSRAINAARRRVMPNRFSSCRVMYPTSRPRDTERINMPSTSDRCSDAMDRMRDTFSARTASNTSRIAGVIVNRTDMPPLARSDRSALSHRLFTSRAKWSARLSASASNFSSHRFASDCMARCISVAALASCASSTVAGSALRYSALNHHTRLACISLTIASTRPWYFSRIGADGRIGLMRIPRTPTHCKYDAVSPNADDEPFVSSPDRLIQVKCENVFLGDFFPPDFNHRHLAYPIPPASRRCENPNRRHDRFRCHPHADARALRRRPRCRWSYKSGRFARR